MFLYFFLFRFNLGLKNSESVSHRNYPRYHSRNEPKFDISQESRFMRETNFDMGKLNPGYRTMYGN